ncbi:MAG TPA: hypothetical protein VGK40_00570 [Verrucomicrobiae bacterium]
MKTFFFTAVFASVAFHLPAADQPKGAEALVAVPKQAPPPVPVPVLLAPTTGNPPPAPPPQVYVYDQKPLAGRPALIKPEQAQAIIDKFKAAYAKLGSPRLLIYVNRELVDENSGLKLTSRTEHTESRVTKSTAETSTEKVTANNRYRAAEQKEPTLADKQTVRDVERLFGRPLRMGGASLADQRVATQLIADRPVKDLAANESARKDREALSKIADVVVEVLISSKNVTVSEIAGDQTYAVPDIQATAIRLKDAAVLGQASSSDIIGGGRAAGHAARNYDVREIAEATALALMEEMAGEAK